MQLHRTPHRAEASGAVDKLYFVCDGEPISRSLQTVMKLMFYDEMRCVGRASSVSCDWSERFDARDSAFRMVRNINIEEPWRNL